MGRTRWMERWCTQPWPCCSPSVGSASPWRHLPYHLAEAVVEGGVEEVGVEAVVVVKAE